MNEYINFNQHAHLFTNVSKKIQCGTTYVKFKHTNDSIC